MLLTTIEELFKNLQGLPLDTKVYVCGTSGYLNIINDNKGKTAISFDDNEELFY